LPRHLSHKGLNQCGLLCVPLDVISVLLGELGEERSLRGGVNAFLLQLGGCLGFIVALNQVFEQIDATDDASSD
jgi:hypothetical protein